MTERKKIIELATKSSASVGQWGDSVFTYAGLEAFYLAAQADAFEQAAAMLDTMESEWYDGDQFRPNLPGDCADAIRQLGKEMK